jgi:methylmalonyl-CoA mutase C-terminal domain/subunit
VAAEPRRPLRVLLAKPGLDGHERGVKVIARLLRDEGHEVIYGGIRQRPEVIARAALQEDVDVVGLSILSGAHVWLTREVIEAMRAEGVDDIPLVVGGTIPAADVQTLLDLGAVAVFGVGSNLDDIRDWFRRR